MTAKLCRYSGNILSQLSLLNVQTKDSQMEEALAALSGEVAESLAGMRATLTAMLRKIERLEMRDGEGVQCVATREALSLRAPGGMDAWCAENCRKGNCPSNLCACPVGSE